MLYHLEEAKRGWLYVSLGRSLSLSPTHRQAQLSDGHVYARRMTGEEFSDHYVMKSVKHGGGGIMGGHIILVKDPSPR